LVFSAENSPLFLDVHVSTEIKLGFIAKEARMVFQLPLKAACWRSVRTYQVLLDNMQVERRIVEPTGTGQSIGQIKRH
jgi:hypothetical protein